MRYHHVLAGLLAIGFGCSGAKEKKKEQVVEAKLAQTLPDDGPRIAVELGEYPSKDFGARTIQAKTVDTIGGHTYVTFDNPETTLSYLHGFDVVANTPTHAVVGNIANQFTVRFVGKSAPTSFSVQMHRYETYGDRHGSRLTLNVEVPKSTVGRKQGKADAEFYRALSEAIQHNQSWNSVSQFHNFAATRLTEMWTEKQPQQNPRVTSPRRMTDVSQIVGLYSGAISIRETLQQDRALWLRGDNDKRTIDLKDLSRLTLDEIPWDRMLTSLGKKPVIEPIASQIPSDMAYLHFHDLRTFMKLVRELDDWVSPVGQQIEGRPGARHFMSYYEDQLILERSGIAEKLGHEAAHDVAIVIGDAFVREGTDVSMIFRVKNQGLLDTALKAFEVSKTAGRKDVQRETEKVGDVVVTRTYSVDLTLNRYRADYGGLTVISNSLGAIKHLLDAHNKKVKTLDQSGDFQYMRTVQPFGEKNEDGFVFISDAFVMRSVSPAIRILNSRRFQAEADLLAVNYAALLHAMMEGKPAKSISDLTNGPILRQSETKHARGEAILFSQETGAESSWGNARMLRPLRDMTIGRVTEAEANGYKLFVENYQNYWTNYFDPIGIQIKRQQDGKLLDFDLRILPLIANSEYDRLIDTVGRTTAPIKPTKSGMSYTLALGAEASIRRFAEMGTTSALGTDLKFSWLGDWVQIGTADHSAIWDLAVLSGAVRTAAKVKKSNDALFDVLQRTPLFAAAHVANQLALAGVLAKLRQYVGDAAPGTINWGPKGEPYRDIQIVSVSSTDEKQPFAIHYAIVRDVIVASLSEPFLKMQIDRFLDPSVGEIAQSAIELDLKKESWLAKTAASLFEKSAFDVHRVASHEYRALRYAFGDNVDPKQHGLFYLGYEPRSPMNGTFSTDATGRTVHSQLGPLDQQVVNQVPLNTAVQGMLDKLQHVLGTISFVSTDETPGLHAHVTMTWE